MTSMDLYSSAAAQQKVSVHVACTSAFWCTIYVRVNVRVCTPVSSMVVWDVFTFHKQQLLCHLMPFPLQ